MAEENQVPQNRHFEATITGHDIVEPASRQCSPDEGFDILLILQEDDGTEHQWRSEFSGRYGLGTLSQYTQCEITMRSLKNIGWDIDPSTILEALPELVGKRIPAEVVYTKNEMTGKVYKNVRIGRAAPVSVDKATASNIIMRLTGKKPTTKTATTSANAAIRPMAFDATPKKMAAPANPFEGF